MIKADIYFHTIRHLRLSQIRCRLRRTMKLQNALGCTVPGGYTKILPICTPDALDFDEAFLARFDVDELLADKVTFLHESTNFDWNGPWICPEKTPLWNFNLHYFEYLLPLVKRFEDTGDQKYWKKAEQCIRGWIERNPQAEGGAGWSPYTISLRLTNWLSCFQRVSAFMRPEFQRRMVRSMHEQYQYLTQHLERDLLANHYFENLKAIILCALFFCEDTVLEKALMEFQRQCREQILPDGMHFELSPMYHKIMLEDILRVAIALKHAGKADAEIEHYIGPMLNVAYSFEYGLERLPLFNDCGNNVAKSVKALAAAAESAFGIRPLLKTALPDSGYYFFRHGIYTLIVDAGQPGADCNPGHAHCDAMSFELFRMGKPVLVNCGTYAYQSPERPFFRGTSAHNTVMINHTEQSQCWGIFRVAKRARVKVTEVHESGICMELTDCAGRTSRRTIQLDDCLTVTDQSLSQDDALTTFVHVASDSDADKIRESILSGESRIERHPYSEEFGTKREIPVIVTTAQETITMRLPLSESV